MNYTACRQPGLMVPTKNTKQMIGVMDFSMEMCILMTENERQLKYKQEGSQTMIPKALIGGLPRFTRPILEKLNLCN